MSDDLERAAENMREVANSMTFTAEECAEAAGRLHEIAYNFWGDLMKKFPKLNIDVCAGCGCRCFFDFASGKDHPCPQYKKTLYCRFRHWITEKFEKFYFSRLKK